MDNRILTKEEKETLQIIKSSFYNISDEGAMDMLNTAKRLADASAIKTSSDKD